MTRPLDFKGRFFYAKKRPEFSFYGGETNDTL